MAEAVGGLVIFAGHNLLPEAETVLRIKVVT
jgi:hypothetical protein